MITLITVRGTGEAENGPDNLLVGVTRQLDPAKYTFGLDLPYPASLGSFNPEASLVGNSEFESVVVGVANLADAIRKAPNPVGLLAYSLGAEVVSTLLVMMQQGKLHGLEVAWAAMIADPLRAEGESIDGPDSVVGEGINGPHEPYPPNVQVFHVANKLDGITCCPLGSPLRRLADDASNFTFANLSWSRGLADRLLRQRWQHVDWVQWLHPFLTWRDYQAAADLMYGYLVGGQHDRAYRTGGYLDRLAVALNAL